MGKIAIVGCDASGKTVLISSLSDYYKAGSHANQSCIMVPADGATRRYTDMLHRVMRINGEWPEATSDIAGNSPLKWKMVRDGKEIAQLEMLDFGGENFRYAFRDDETTKNPEVVARLKAYIENADFVIITVSMDKMLRNLTPSVYRELEQGDIEYDRDSEAQWVTDGLLKMVQDKVAANPPGVVVALTQADKHRAELAEHGGAKALFAKCWPSIAMMYPSVNVVPCASIDRMSAEGRPADGYSTEGVLTVMKEFVRYAYGESEDLFKKLEELKKTISEINTEKDVKKFVMVMRYYRAALEALIDKSTIIGEDLGERVKPFTAFADEYKDRFEKASAAEEVTPPAKAESRDEPVKPPRGGGSLRTILLLALLAATASFALWNSKVRHHQTQAANTAVMEARAEAEAKVQEAEAERASAQAAQAKAEAARAVQAKAEAEAQAKAVAAEKAKAEAEAKIRELEELRAKETARMKAEAEAKAKEAEAKIRELEELRAKEVARMKAEADAKAKLEAEKARVKAEEEARARATLEAEKAKAKAVADFKAEERERKYQEFRERQRSEVLAKETSGLFESLVASINGAMLERGRNLIAELSTDRPLSESQSALLGYAKAFMDHLEKAQNGNADDMVWIGNQYYTSKDSFGIIKDPREACLWYTRASALGNAKAYYFLSLMSEQGEGCKRDNALSGRYCLKAARLGHAEAMFWTGVYFREGSHGFEQSDATAFKYFVMARNAGFENPGLGKMIQSVQAGSDEETIDSWYPSDPHKAPTKPRRWWGLGLF